MVYYVPYSSPICYFGSNLLWNSPEMRSTGNALLQCFLVLEDKSETRADTVKMKALAAAGRP